MRRSCWMRRISVHVQTQLCVQIGKRLVHQQNLGPQHQHARERHALLFAARS